ncbi:ras and EF-hand domain-containing protein, partial [Clarias magur]
MSSRKFKKNQKLGSSRRNKNRNKDIEENEDDDGFPDPGNEKHDSEHSQFSTVSKNQESKEPAQFDSDQPVIASTSKNPSELSPHPQLYESKNLTGQAEVTNKKRKMGSTRKSNRELKFGGIYEDEPELGGHVCVEGIKEQGETVEVSIKENSGKEDQTSLSDCAPNQSAEDESSNLQEEDLAHGTTMHNEDDHNNDEHQHLETAIQSKLMDSSSSELNQSKEEEFSQDLIHTSLDFSIFTQTECNVALQESDESLKICQQMDTFTTDHKSSIDTTTPLNENREEGQDVQMSLNNLIHNDKLSMMEQNVLKTMDDQSSYKREDVDTLDSCSAKEKNEVTEVQSVALIDEHEHGTQDDKMATDIWPNVISKAYENKDEDHLKKNDDSLNVAKESSDKSKSRELREDTDEYKEDSDPFYMSEPESRQISHPDSEARPGIEEVKEAVGKGTNASTEAGLVSLDTIRKTSPGDVGTGGRPKIDFDQWNEQIPDFGVAVYNIVMVGNSNVGKTSFIKRLQNGHFIPDYSATIGVDTFVQTVTFGSRTVKLYVWDTAGQERYHSITRQVFHKAQGLLLMYDITSSQSFQAVRAWISQVQEKAPPDVILMLLGNKNDRADREVQLKEGEDLSKEYDIDFMECSAATGENVLESLKTLACSWSRKRKHCPGESVQITCDQDHVTNGKLERVLAMIQGANQKALIMYSRVDLNTQEAYELAVKGQFRPQDKSPPILTGLRCVGFKPPHFKL